MGTKNRQRRAAKAKQRARRQGDRRRDEQARHQRREYDDPGAA